MVDHEKGNAAALHETLRRDQPNLPTTPAPIDDKHHDAEKNYWWWSNLLGMVTAAAAVGAAVAACFALSASYKAVEIANLQAAIAQNAFVAQSESEVSFTGLEKGPGADQDSPITGYWQNTGHKSASGRARGQCTGRNQSIVEPFGQVDDGNTDAFSNITIGAGIRFMAINVQKIPIGSLKAIIMGNTHFYCWVEIIYSDRITKDIRITQFDMEITMYLDALGHPVVNATPVGRHNCADDACTKQE